MFTGIIRHRGTVRELVPGDGCSRLTVDVDELAGTLVAGASIAVNGVCLTVAEHADSRVGFDVIPETLQRTALNRLKPGQRVNLEPSLRAGDPIDGHFVQGHVDGTARLVHRQTGREGHVLRFRPQQDLRPYLVPKGSVAIDGVSLTLAGVGGDEFTVALIPTTLQWTTLADLCVGDTVNIETDIIARTIVHRLQNGSPPKSVTIQTLHEHGFVS